MDKVREIALKALYEININQAYSNLALKKALSNKELDLRDRAFVTELVYGTITWRLTLDWVISQFSKVKLRKLSNWVLEILRMGTYQIMFLDKVPPSAACNTSVNLAKKYAKQSTGYINAILRNITRNKDRITFEHINESSVSRKLSIKYSFPEYLTEEWILDFGAEFTESLLSSLLERPDFFIRINTLKTSRDAIIQELNSNQIEVLPGRFLPEALRLKNVSDISESDPFMNGKVFVQDESSMLVTKILDPQPNERILDVCAAPGGKTTHIAQSMNNKGHIDAWDIHEHKIDLINENAKRLGIDIISASQRDALELYDKKHDVYDKVLVDAPCSGTGIIRRKPDIKWKRKKEDFSSLVEIQKKILYNSSRYVKLGGVLVYSTCSLNKRENEQVMSDFLSENQEFETQSLKPYLPEGLSNKTHVDEGMLKLYPHIDGTDGFFISRMRRKAH